MAAVHPLKTFLATARTYFAAQVSGLTVKTEVVAADQLGTSDFPCLMLQEGPARADHSITSTTDDIRTVVMRLVHKGDVDTGRDLEEAINIALHNNPQMTGTCLYCLLESGDPPLLWDSGQFKFRDRYMTVALRIV